jgi:hypothetical protein
MDYFARRSAALGAAKHLCGVNRALRVTLTAKNYHGNFFNDQLGTPERRIFTCHFIRGEQRIFDDAGQEAQAKVHGSYLHTASAL